MPLKNNSIRSSKMERNGAHQATQLSKKLRSKLPHRKRTHFSPILCGLSDYTASGFKSTSLEVSLNSNYDEFSCNTTRDAVVRAADDVFRRETRAYSKQKENERAKRLKLVEFEVSENSCVESCSIAEAESDFQSTKYAKVGSNSAQITSLAADCDETVTKPDAGKYQKTDVITVPEISKRNDEVELSDITQNYVNINSRIPNSASTIDQKTNNNRIDSDLACSEHFSDDNVSEYSLSTFSELQSEVFGDNSELDFSDDYTPSLWLESGSQFSEKSFEDVSPSPCFTLLQEYRQQLLKLTNSDQHFSSHAAEEYSDDDNFWRFENEEDEESYQRLRDRERKPTLVVNDYAEVYTSSEYGSLIVEQRLLMVNWIVEQSRTKKLHDETTYLGIRLLDRFLSQGFFGSKRNLQIVGIACLTLATRIEENQPYNSVRQSTFSVEANVYTRAEVVAMEWLVQEILKFQCFSPTIYNFLWFYLKAATADEEMEKKAKYLTGLVLFNHNLLRFWPSSVAASVVILVSLAAEQETSCQRVMATHFRTKLDDLAECLKGLEWLVQYACQ